MRKQWIALLLAAALALSLCAVPALAQTEEETEKPAGETAAGETAAGEESAGEAALPEEDGKPIVVLPEEPSGGTAADSTMEDELVFTGEDDFRYLAFEDLKDRVLEGSLTAKMLRESIASIDAMDYTQMYVDLSGQLSSLEYTQSMYAQIPVASPMEGAMQGYVISNLASSYGAITSGTPPPPSGSSRTPRT